MIDSHSPALTPKLMSIKQNLLDRGVKYAIANFVDIHGMCKAKFETDFAYDDVLKMSDRLTFFRLMVKEIARKHSYFASLIFAVFSRR